jgi:hypothetical protein
MSEVSYPKDMIIDEVLKRIAKRSDDGLAKFGVSMDDATQPPVYWIDQAIEEAMDLAVYLTKLKALLTNEPADEMYERLLARWGLSR